MINPNKIQISTVLMKLIFLLFFLPFFPGIVIAQKTKTMFHANGQKAIEGNWKIGSYAVLPNTFLDFSHKEYHISERNRKIMNIPDYPGNYWEYNEMLLKMEFDGPVKMWYPNGHPMAEMNFEGGLINGSYTAYHENGMKAMQGMLKDGMPEGDWTAWYMDGTIFFTGRFAAYGTKELEERWATAYSLKANPFALKQNIEQPYEEFDTLRNDLAIVTDGLRFSFTDAIPQTISKKDGKFIVYKRNGSKWAEMEFAGNVRTGHWKMYENDSLIKYQLFYNQGKLMGVKEGRLPKETLIKYAARWEAEQKKKQSESIGTGIAGWEARPPISWSDEPPRFEGNVQQYLREHVRVNPAAKVRDVEGTYVVRFYVETDGRITRVIIEQGKSKELNKELVRVFEDMPKWKPGKHNNKEVSKLTKVTFVYGLSSSY